MNSGSIAPAAKQRHFERRLPFGLADFQRLPLTDAKFRTIASNVAPYVEHAARRAAGHADLAFSLVTSMK